jgi:predicted PurR-regulated permease PerM
VHSTSPPPAPSSAQPRRAIGVADLWSLAAAALALAMAWALSDVLLLAFAGVLFGLVLLLLARPLKERLHLPAQMALALVIIGLLVLIVGGSWLLGASAGEQLQTLRETLPKAWDALQQWLGTSSPGRWLLQVWKKAQFKPDDWSRMAFLASGTFNATVSAVGSMVLLVFIGIYLATEPQTYRQGIVRLVAPRWRGRAEQVLDALGHDLGRWLVGQGVSMLSIGVLTAIALSLVGMPLVATLSVVAGVLEFIPYFGPIATGLLVVAVALTGGQTLAFWAALACFAVQQIEAYLVQPLVQSWAVRLPPVMGMLAVVIFGLLFGLAGVLLAVPLMVVTMTLVDQLYVRGVLEPAAEIEDGAGTARGPEGGVAHPPGTPFADGVQNH